MNIIISANSKYMRYLYVMLTSLFENNKRENITVYVMQRDFTENDEKFIRELGEKFEISVEFLYVEESLFAGLPTNSKFSLETYFRLIMSELLPDTVDKILYLDVDIIIRGNIRSFYDTDITDYIAAACQDTDHPVLEKKKKELFHRTGDMRYFNAGVMLWNIKRLRAEYSFDCFMKAAAELGFLLQYADQEILNYLLYNHIYYCDAEKYNFIVRGEQNESEIGDGNALILHYAGCNPWQNGQKNNLYRIWWDYAKKTPFYMGLLEENLWREIGFGSEKEANVLRDMESREIYEFAFYLKKEGRIKKHINLSNKKIAIYGTGVMAEVLYDLLSSDGVWDKVVMAVDKNKSGYFHCVPIAGKVSSMDNVVWVITPVYRSQELIKSVRESLSNEDIVISLREWLKNIV